MSVLTLIFLGYLIILIVAEQMVATGKAFDGGCARGDHVYGG